MFRADPATGELLPVAGALPDAPDGVIYKPCGDRRASVCPPCAERYRQDTWQLIAAGLRGGKGVPAEVAGHPAAFLTLTAPSFGLVHTRRTASTGRVLPCRPRRKPAPCPHGTDLRCSRHHDQDEAAVAAVGVPGLTFHDLRHTGATLAARTGASLRDLMQRIGHDSTAAAIRYQHASREADEAIAAAIEDVITRAREDGDDGPAGELVPSGT